MGRKGSDDEEIRLLLLLPQGAHGCVGLIKFGFPFREARTKTKTSPNSFLCKEETDLRKHAYIINSQSQVQPLAHTSVCNAEVEIECRGVIGRKGDGWGKKGSDDEEIGLLLLPLQGAHGCVG